MQRSQWMTAAIVSACVALPALGIVRRHDLTDADYLDYARQSQFAPVGRVYGNYAFGGREWRGSGTLIGDRFILTAAHVVDSRAFAGWSYDFGDGVAFYNAANVFIHPNWDGVTYGVEGAADLAIIELDRPVTGVQGARLASTPVPFGMEVSLAGYGGTGDGIRGWDGENDRLLRAGTNRIEPLSASYARDILTFDFTSPSSPDVTPLEAFGMFGDSGGPVMGIVGGRWEVLGVHSFIETLGIGVGVYGDRMGSTAVAPYRDWMDTIIPAPGGGLVLAAGVLLLSRRRR